MFSLHGKVALVTGASRGLGRGIALALAKAGADVVVNFLSSKSEAETVVEGIRALGRRSIAVRANVGDAEDVERLFSQIDRHFGRLDILVNNAGTARAESIFETSLDSWNTLINNNLTSTFLCAKAAIERMRKQKHGRIIQISSIVGHRGALFGHVHYAATKSGQLGFTKTLARTAAEYGITVNAIAPGLIDTELLRQTHSADELERLRADIPLGLGSTDDVGAVAVFLASDEARYITGATIDVNGGMYMR